MRIHRGFSRADGVALCLVGLLVLLSVPTLWAQADGRQTELAKRANCARNLRDIVQSMNVYGIDFQDAFPTLPPPKSATTYSVDGMKPEEGETTIKGALKTLYADNSHSDNPLNNLWLLVIRGDISPKVFLCPSDPVGNKMALASTRSDKVKGVPVSEAEAGNYYRTFQDEKNTSYSVMYPWTEENGKVVVYKAWTVTIDAALPIMSDMAPFMGSTDKQGRKQVAVDTEFGVKNVNSDNHQGDGQNVVFGDHHVEFTRKPDCGNNKDSLWGVTKNGRTVGEGEVALEAGTLPHPLKGTQGLYDIVMVPMRDGKGDLR